MNSPGSYKNILVRGVNRIGDTVFSLPAVKALKQAFPGARLTVLTKPLPAGLFKNNPCVDEVLIFDSRDAHAGIGGRLRLARELRGKGFDLAVVFHNCFDAALAPFLAGIPERIGYRKELRGPLLTRKLPFPQSAVHQVDHYLALTALCGAATEDRVPELFITSEEKEDALRFVSQNNVRRPLIGFIPGAVALTRRWSPERFAHLGDRLAAATGGSVLILGGPDEKEISKAIRQRMRARPFDMTGTISLRGLMALLGLCDLVVSNDTGPMHLAWTLGRPVVTFVGAADIREIRPLSPRVRIIRKDLPCSPCIREVCPEGHTRCLDLITVDEAFETAMEALKETWNPETSSLSS
ncbi:MAG: lipopolysaccharide heptosyltransferase II [Nitrospirota bacterium]